VAKLQPKQKVSPMPLQTPDRLNAPIDAVSGDALMQSCAGFATRMKLSGTADELASLREVQAKLDGFGFRTNMMLHDAYISLPLDARVEVDGVALTSITHSFSRPSPAGGLTAPVIDIGHGTAAEVAGRDLRGAIVLVSGIASPGLADLATQAGAVGQLHISPHEHLHEMCISPVWGSPGLSTLNALPGTVACTISLADGEALRARLLAGETPVVTLHAAVDTGWRKTPLLVAEMDGPEAEGPFVLFSGHHDTWYFGVMDNGSANATMIEAARVLELPRVVIHAARIDATALPPAAVITARALAPLANLLGYAHRILAPGGVAIFPKGRSAAQELTDASAAWIMRVERFPSRTDPSATILRLSEIHPAGSHA
jgi:hypothetical protein